MNALELGLILGELRHRQETHSGAISRLERDLTRVKERLQRMAILTLLWSCGLAAHLETERLAELVTGMLKALFQAGRP